MKIVVDSCVLIDSFQRDSPNRTDSIALIEHLVKIKQLITMPAHGWFELWVNINRLSNEERKYLHPVFGGEMQLPLELIHIDAQFIGKYGNVRLPYAKASDHIYIVVAKVNEYPLITWDLGMTNVAKAAGVHVINPNEFMAAVAPE